MLVLLLHDHTHVDGVVDLGAVLVLLLLDLLLNLHLEVLLKPLKVNLFGL